MTTTEIREALLAVEQAVDVPPADQVAFQARVRAERRRRTAGRALVAAAAAAAVVTAGIAGNAVLGDPESTPLANTPGETADRSVPDTVFFTLDNRLTALDPQGVVHDLGQYSEGVIGWTEDRLYALDDDSHITVRRAEPPFAEVPGAPTPDPVQSVALSGDGRYLAWLGLDDMVHRYDLVAGSGGPVSSRPRRTATSPECPRTGCWWRAAAGSASATQPAEWRSPSEGTSTGGRPTSPVTSSW